MTRTTEQDAITRHGRRRIALACALALALVPAATAEARLGDLDPAFDGDGIATPSVGGVAGASFEAVATRPDGRPVAAGTDPAGAFVAQLTNAGAPDAFGTSGVIRFANGNSTRRLHAVALDDSGRVIAAGDRSAPPAPAEPFVLRLTSGGAFDGEFTLLGTQVGEAHAIVPLPGGAILLAGWLDNSTSPDVFFVARLTDTGATDTTFGARGIATAGFGLNAHAEAMSVAPDGRIVLAGWAEVPGAGPPQHRPALAIFDAAGNLVTSTTLVGPAGELHAVKVDGIGRIIAAGESGGSAFVTRRLADGSPDASFGTGGAVSGPAPSALNGLALDGARALVAGAGGAAQLLLGSLDGAGVPEPALGGAPPGWRGFPGAAAASGAALAPGGAVYTAGGPAPFVARHLPNAAPAAALAGPAQVIAGAPAVFDASGSGDPEGEQLRYAFDLDGNGDFEFDGGTNPIALRSFAAPGAYAVGVRVTDPRNASATAARAITVVAAPVPQPQPQLGKQGVAKLLRGVVRYRPRGAKKFLPLLDTAAIPNGTEIDARKGRLLLTVLHDASGRLDGARFYAGRFFFRQGKGKEPITRLKLSGGSFDNCAIQARGASLASAASVKGGTGTGTRRPRRRVRRLWGDGRGRFRTRGRYGAATVRGTKWLTVDRCDGTKFRVVRGKVGVVGFAPGLRGQRLLTAGESTFLPAVQRGG